MLWGRCRNSVYGGFGVLMIFGESVDLLCGLCDGQKFSLDTVQTNASALSNGLSSIEIWIKCADCDLNITFIMESLVDGTMSCGWEIEKSEGSGH